MPEPHGATGREREQVATSSFGDGQTTLAGADEDGTHQAALTDAVGAATGADGPDDRGDEREVVNAFPVRDRVLVRHYFEGGAYGVLEPYYDRRNYRFDVPRDEFRRVRAELDGHGYDLRLVEDLASFAVVVRKYRAHPETVFEDAVVEFANDDFNVFVLADRRAVGAAVEGGAERLADAPVTVRFPTAHGTGPLTVADLTAGER